MKIQGHGFPHETQANKTDAMSRWIHALVERRGHNRACVALANKLARVAWVIMATGQRYQPAA